MKLEFSRQILDKFSNIKFYENPSSGSRVVPCGRTDMSKLTVAFRNFVRAPKNEKFNLKPSAPHHTDNLKTKAPNTTGSTQLYNTLELLRMGIMVPETC